MNKKIIKTICSITYGLGLVSSTPFIASSCGCSSTPISKVEIKYSGNKSLSLKVNEKPIFDGVFSIYENGEDKTNEYTVVLPAKISNNLKITDNKLLVYQAWTENYNADFYVKAVNKATNKTLAYLDGFTVTVTGGDTDKTIDLTSSIIGTLCYCSKETAVDKTFTSETIFLVNTIGLPDDAQFNWHIIPEDDTTASDFSEWLVNGKINIISNDNSLFALNLQFIKTSITEKLLHFYIYCEDQSTGTISNKIHGLSISIYC